MRRVRFGRTDVEVSAIAIGTWSFGGEKVVDGSAVGWSGHDGDAAAAALEAAHGAGINHWDTADVYGDGASEEIIGRLWDRVPRDEVFLASKVGWDPGGFDHPYHPELMRRHIDRSLKLLQTDTIDLYYLHHCNFGPEDTFLDAAVESLHRFRDEGKIRFVGLSDWDASRIADTLLRVDPDVIQPYRNLLDDAYASSPLPDLVRERDLGVAFFSPLKHGLLLGKYDQPATFSEGDMRNRIEGFRDPDLLSALRRCRESVQARFSDHPEPVLHAITAPLLADTPSASLLLGQRNPAQAAAAATLGEALPPEEIAWIRSLYESTS